MLVTLQDDGVVRLYDSVEDAVRHVEALDSGCYRRGGSRRERDRDRAMHATHGEQFCCGCRSGVMRRIKRKDFMRLECRYFPEWRLKRQVRRAA